MDRSITAVLFGTFTLRFSTGLTGGLLVYYLADLPVFGGAQVESLGSDLCWDGEFLYNPALTSP